MFIRFRASLEVAPAVVPGHDHPTNPVINSSSWTTPTLTHSSPTSSPIRITTITTPATATPTPRLLLHHPITTMSQPFHPHQWQLAAVELVLTTETCLHSIWLWANNFNSSICRRQTRHSSYVLTYSHKKYLIILTLIHFPDKFWRSWEWQWLLALVI